MNTLLATSICQTLFEAGHTAYFAGGWVRDLLMGHPTEDIDIATSATPEEVQKLFPKTIPVGISFGVVIVVLEGINFEVTTFRKDHPYHDGRHPDGVDFSTPEKDASRRDFTINGLFYDPLSEHIYDYVDGRADIEKKIIRAIGDPEERFTEDRLRMIRAVRFSARFNFPIEEKTKEAIKHHASTLLPAVSMERIWQELNKMSSYPHFNLAVLELHELGLLEVIFPDLKGRDISEKVASFPYFPLRCPTIVYLNELLPTRELCEYLKASGEDKKLLEFFRTPLPEDLHGWAHFYAHRSSELYIDIQAAKILPPQRSAYIKEHEMRKEQLKTHIDRIVHRTPLVTSMHLKKAGIQPGKEMGELLKKAEKLAINRDLETPEEVLALLLKAL